MQETGIHYITLFSGSGWELLAPSYAFLCKGLRYKWFLNGSPAIYNAGLWSSWCTVFVESRSQRCSRRSQKVYPEATLPSVLMSLSVCERALLMQLVRVRHRPFMWPLHLQLQSLLLGLPGTLSLTSCCFENSQTADCQTFHSWHMQLFGIQHNMTHCRSCL